MLLLPVTRSVKSSLISALSISKSLFKLILVPDVTKFGLPKAYSVLVFILDFNCCLVNLQTLPLVFCISIISLSSNVVSAVDLVISISILLEPSITIPEVEEAVNVFCLVAIANSFARPLPPSYAVPDVVPITSEALISTYAVPLHLYAL